MWRKAMVCFVFLDGEVFPRNGPCGSFSCGEKPWMLCLWFGSFEGMQVGMKGYNQLGLRKLRMMQGRTNWCDHLRKRLYDEGIGTSFMMAAEGAVDGGSPIGTVAFDDETGAGAVEPTVDESGRGIKVLGLF
jgi:hypothetical protein